MALVFFMMCVSAEGGVKYPPYCKLAFRSAYDPIDFRKTEIPPYIFLIPESVSLGFLLLLHHDIKASV